VVDLSSIRVLIFREDNYVHAVDNRSEFPLRGGFVTLTSGHPNWNRTSDMLGRTRPFFMVDLENSWHFALNRARSDVVRQLH
jgi:hypothetical protein